MALDVYFRDDIAGFIVGILVEKGSPDSRDLRALAALVRMPWTVIEAAYWQQMGVKAKEVVR